MNIPQRKNTIKKTGRSVPQVLNATNNSAMEKVAKTVESLKPKNNQRKQIGSTINLPFMIWRIKSN